MGEDNLQADEHVIWGEWSMQRVAGCFPTPHLMHLFPLAAPELYPSVNCS